MKLSDDLPPSLIYLKAVLFFVLLMISSALVIYLDERWMRAVCLIPVIWSTSRLYYFFFYVLERYLGEDRPFSGIGEMIRHLAGRRKS